MFADSVSGRKWSSGDRGARLLLALLPVTFATVALLAVLGTPSAGAAPWAASTSFSTPTSVAVSGSGKTDDKGGTLSARPKVRITKVRLFPGRGWIYADGYLDMQVQVTNKGDGIARRIPVYLTSSRKGRVKAPRVIVIQQVLPGWTATRTFRVRAERSARGWVMIQADSEGRRNRSFLRLIRPWW